MNIIVQVSRISREHECATGKKPTRVYFGTAQWLAICHELKYFGIDRPFITHRPSSCVRLHGMRVFLVEDADHLACAWSAEDGA